MGVKNWDFISWQVGKINTIHPAVIAIDAPNYLMKRIRSIENRIIQSLDRISTIHVSIVLGFIKKALASNILPVFIFDGIPEHLKRSPNPELIRTANDLYREFSRTQDPRDIFLVQSLHDSPSLRWYFSAYHIMDICSAIGVPAITSPTEAEMAAALLCKDGFAGTCLSNDVDALLFGSPHVSKSIRYSKDEVEYTTLDSVLKSIGLDIEQLRDLAILSGCDFSPGVKGIGPRKGAILLKRFGFLEDVLRSLGFLQSEREEFIRARETFDEVNRLFINTSDLQLRSPLSSRLTKILNVVMNEDRAEILTSEIIRTWKRFGTYQTTLEVWF